MPFPMKGNSHRQVGRAGNATKRGGGTRAALPPACHFPLSPHTLHPLPYPHAHAHAPDRATSPAPPADHECGRRHRPPPPPALPRCGCRAWALPCFPLSVSRHFPPRPSAHVRPAPCQIRLVPLFRPFQHPPAGPLAPHPVRAWQIRLVSLCRLVRRASIPSCTASLQARTSRKKARQDNSKQLKPSAAKVWAQGLPCQAEGAEPAPAKAGGLACLADAPGVVYRTERRTPRPGGAHDRPHA